MQCGPCIIHFNFDMTEIWGTRIRTLTHLLMFDITDIQSLIWENEHDNPDLLLWNCHLLLCCSSRLTKLGGFNYFSFSNIHVKWSGFLFVLVICLFSINESWEVGTARTLFKMGISKFLLFLPRQYRILPEVYILKRSKSFSIVCSEILLFWWYFSIIWPTKAQTCEMSWCLIDEKPTIEGERWEKFEDLKFLLSQSCTTLSCPSATFSCTTCLEK